MMPDPDDPRALDRVRALWDALRRLPTRSPLELEAARAAAERDARARERGLRIGLAVLIGCTLVAAPFDARAGVLVALTAFWLLCLVLTRRRA